MSTGSTQPFRVTSTVTIAATTTSKAAELPAEGGSALVYNATSAVAFVRFGTDLTVSATGGDMPVPPGGRVLLDIGQLASSAAALLSSGSGSVFISRGDGTVY
jgi:hypothetical protein